MIKARNRMFHQRVVDSETRSFSLSVNEIHTFSIIIARTEALAL